MAELRSLDSTLEKDLSDLSGLGISLELRSEQKEAISTLLFRKEVVAVLSTGFVKTLIFQLFVGVRKSCHAACVMSCHDPCVIVVCSLKSIVQDQIFEDALMDLSPGGRGGGSRYIPGWGGAARPFIS